MLRPLRRPDRHLASPLHPQPLSPARVRLPSLHSLNRLSTRPSQQSLTPAPRPTLRPRPTPASPLPPSTRARPQLGLFSLVRQAALLAPTHTPPPSLVLASLPIPALRPLVLPLPTPISRPNSSSSRLGVEPPFPRAPPTPTPVTLADSPCPMELPPAAASTLIIPTAEFSRVKVRPTPTPHSDSARQEKESSEL